MIKDPVTILLFGVIIGGAFAVGVARANIIRGVDMKKSLRIALLATGICSVAAYLVILMYRWLL